MVAITIEIRGGSRSHLSVYEDTDEGYLPVVHTTCGFVVLKYSYAKILSHVK